MIACVEGGLNVLEARVSWDAHYTKVGKIIAVHFSLRRGDFFAAEPPIYYCNRREVVKKFFSLLKSVMKNAIIDYGNVDWSMSSVNLTQGRKRWLNSDTRQWIRRAKR